MQLNEYGKLAWKQWEWLAEQYPYVVLHAFVVMPDHVHGIIEINRDHIDGSDRDLTQMEKCEYDVHGGSGRDLTLQDDRDMTLPDGKRIKIKSLSELIGAYKTTVSKQIHLLGYTKFAWQRSFHDRIIHHEQEYIHDTEYILSNPSNWNLKKYSRGM